jgi:hypothetical protein
MDKIILRKLPKKAIIEKCGSCVFGKGRDLQAEDPPKGWVYCIQWNAIQPFHGWCSEWKS